MLNPVHLLCQDRSSSFWKLDYFVSFHKTIGWMPWKYRANSLSWMKLSVPGAGLGAGYTLPILPIMVEMRMLHSSTNGCNGLMTMDGLIRRPMLVAGWLSRPDPLFSTQFPSYQHPLLI